MQKIHYLGARINESPTNDYMDRIIIQLDSKSGDSDNPFVNTITDFNVRFNTFMDSESYDICKWLLSNNYRLAILKSSNWINNLSSVYISKSYSILEWSSLTTYNQDSVVYKIIYDEYDRFVKCNVYKSLTINNNKNPETNDSDWMLIKEGIGYFEYNHTYNIGDLCVYKVDGKYKLFQNLIKNNRNNPPGYSMTLDFLFENQIALKKDGIIEVDDNNLKNAYAEDTIDLNFNTEETINVPISGTTDSSSIFVGDGYDLLTEIENNILLNYDTTGMKLLLEGMYSRYWGEPTFYGVTLDDINMGDYSYYQLQSDNEILMYFLDSSLNEIPMYFNNKSNNIYKINSDNPRKDKEFLNYLNYYTTTTENDGVYNIYSFNSFVVKHGVNYPDHNRTSLAIFNETYDNETKQRISYPKYNKDYELSKLVIDEVPTIDDLRFQTNDTLSCRLSIEGECLGIDGSDYLLDNNGSSFTLYWFISESSPHYGVEFEANSEYNKNYVVYYETGGVKYYFESLVNKNTEDLPMDFIDNEYWKYLGRSNPYIPLYNNAYNNLIPINIDNYLTPIRASIEGKVLYSRNYDEDHTIYIINENGENESIINPNPELYDIYVENSTSEKDVLVNAGDVIFFINRIDLKELQLNALRVNLMNAGYLVDEFNGDLYISRKYVFNYFEVSSGIKIENWINGSYDILYNNYYDKRIVDFYSKYDSNDRDTKIIIQNNDIDFRRDNPGYNIYVYKYDKDGNIIYQEIHTVTLDESDSRFITKINDNSRLIEVKYHGPGKLLPGEYYLDRVEEYHYDLYSRLADLDNFEIDSTDYELVIDGGFTNVTYQKKLVDKFYKESLILLDTDYYIDDNGKVVFRNFDASDSTSIYYKYFNTAFSYPKLVINEKNYPIYLCYLYMVSKYRSFAGQIPTSMILSNYESTDFDSYLMNVYFDTYRYVLSHNFINSTIGTSTADIILINSRMRNYVYNNIEYNQSETQIRSRFYELAGTILNISNSVLNKVNLVSINKTDYTCTIVVELYYYLFKIDPIRISITINK